MRISSLLDITNGKLLNSPFVTSVANIKLNPNSVKDGDLFIAKDDIEAKQAVDNGAFAIISEFYIPIIDNEIAWIKVDCIKDTITRLIRYIFANSKTKALYCEKNIYDMIKIYYHSSNVDKKIYFLPNNLELIIKNTHNITNCDIVLSYDKKFLSNLLPENQKFIFKSNNYKLTNIIKHSIFETSFSAKINNKENKYFSRIKLPVLYLDTFIKTIDFLKIEQINSNTLNKFNDFKPIFIDNNFTLASYGKSDRFIILQNNIALAKKEILFLKENYKYGKISVISNKSCETIDAKQIKLNCLKTLKTYLKKSNANAFYLIGFSFNELRELLKENLNIPSLFNN